MSHKPFTILSLHLLSLHLLSPPSLSLSSQDYDSMISLVGKITGHQEAEKPAVQVQCAFALNRRNKEGDRSRALAMLEKVTSGTPL